jgi:hypothetical protein
MAPGGIAAMTSRRPPQAVQTSMSIENAARRA